MLRATVASVGVASGHSGGRGFVEADVCPKHFLTLQFVEFAESFLALRLHQEAATFSLLRLEIFEIRQQVEDKSPSEVPVKRHRRRLCG